MSICYVWGSIKMLGAELVLFNWFAKASTCMCTAIANLLWFFRACWTTSHIWLHWLPVQYGFWIDGNRTIVPGLVWRMVWQIKFSPWKEFDMLLKGDNPSWQNMASRTDIGLGMFSSGCMFVLLDDRIGGVSWKKRRVSITIIKWRRMEACNNQLHVLYCWNILLYFMIQRWSCIALMAAWCVDIKRI